MSVSGSLGAHPMMCGLMLLVAGCYGYTGASLDSVRVGEPVRARISGAQAERLEPILGNTGRTIEGQLLEKDDSGIVVAVASPVSSEGSATVLRAYQRVAVSRADLQEVEIRHLDRARTTIAIVGATAAAAVAFAAVSQIVQLGSGGNRSNTNKNRVPIAVTIIRIPLRR